MECRDKPVGRDDEEDSRCVGNCALDHFVADSWEDHEETDILINICIKLQLVGLIFPDIFICEEVLT